MRRAYEESLLATPKCTTTEIRKFDIGEKVMLRRHTNVRNLGDEDSEETSADRPSRTHKNKAKHGWKKITRKWLSRFVGPYEVIHRHLGTAQIRHCSDVARYSYIQ